MEGPSKTHIDASEIKIPCCRVCVLCSIQTEWEAKVSETKEFPSLIKSCAKKNTHLLHFQLCKQVEALFLKCLSFNSITRYAEMESSETHGVFRI